ncbi:MAG: adenine deaminase [Chitinophagaceae bacterium]|nr:adenine deaminase [Chitinophagaceae bacterium]
MNSLNITGNVVDIFDQKVYPATLEIVNGKIISLSPLPGTAGVNPQLPFLVPGFVDSHVHIESSMLVPSEFARLAVVHGTVATISDPHEIANVCGVEGVEFMIDNGNKVPFKFNFGAPSCVPATIFETAGAELDPTAVAQLLARDEIKYLSEMMNFPGVLSKDPGVMQKIAAAHALGKPVDGHAPGLRGELAQQYIDAGISTDHECFTYEEGLDKLQRGMKVLIREGSAARNFDALIDLLHEYPDHIMFCSDDKHPDSLVAGHINQLCERAVAKGINIFNILKAACINPVLHYKLDVGLLRVGDMADFIVLQDLEHFKVLATYIDGNKVAEDGRSLIKGVTATPINKFDCKMKSPDDFINLLSEINISTPMPVIEALDGQLITNKINPTNYSTNGIPVVDLENDILKITVVNRYFDAPVAVGFIKNFGLKEGAIASSVAHDSHNIVAVGVNDECITKAINLVIANRGGVSCANENAEIVLALPVAGLMSAEDGYEVAAAYTAIDAMAKSFGATLSAPFMTLSFMALLVIPHLKLSDKGLFDGDSFKLLNSYSN